MFWLYLSWSHTASSLSFLFSVWKPFSSDRIAKSTTERIDTIPVWVRRRGTADTSYSLTAPVLSFDGVRRLGVQWRPRRPNSHIDPPDTECALVDRDRSLDAIRSWFGLWYRTSIAFSGNSPLFLVGFHMVEFYQTGCHRLL